jgi:hypothetical protein
VLDIACDHFVVATEGACVHVDALAPFLYATPDCILAVIVIINFCTLIFFL